MYSHPGARIQDGLPKLRDHIIVNLGFLPSLALGICSSQPTSAFAKQGSLAPWYAQSAICTFSSPEFETPLVSSLTPDAGSPASNWIVDHFCPKESQAVLFQIQIEKSYKLSKPFFIRIRLGIGHREEADQDILAPAHKELRVPITYREMRLPRCCVSPQAASLACCSVGQLVSIACPDCPQYFHTAANSYRRESFIHSDNCSVFSHSASSPRCRC